ncbi:hypothetical protein DS837_10300 [Azospirillum brasilense]|uniref:Uncharacterized protein n=1 Tax=Azospirillum brasilense TaxID=192 RepID=A0A6L3B206_AZOBR|nr:hypothetical protein DS837_10300 [Azospirillum brasilense]
MRRPTYRRGPPGPPPDPIGPPPAPGPPPGPGPIPMPCRGIGGGSSGRVTPRSWARACIWR